LIVGSQVDFGFIGAHLLTGFESKVRCLGVTTAKRDSVKKSIPTFKEQGVPYGEITTPMMVLAHKDLDDAKYDKLVTAIANMSQKKGFKKFVKKAGLGVSYMSPADGMAYYGQLCRNMKPIIDTAFKPEGQHNCP